MYPLFAKSCERFSLSARDGLVQLTEAIDCVMCRIGSVRGPFAGGT